MKNESSKEEIQIVPNKYNLFTKYTKNSKTNYRIECIAVGYHESHSRYKSPLPRQTPRRV
jgi:hypothetical protein